MILVLAVPFALSFEKNLMLYKRWKFLLPAIFITMLVFVIWDILFTHLGCWAFNPGYISGVYIFKLPLEEYLFFIAVPYACAFSFYAIKFHFPRYKVGDSMTGMLTIVLIIISSILAYRFRNNLYSLVSLMVLISMLVLAFFLEKEVLQYYLAIFPVLLIPFLIVNGILTGTGIEQEVFIYNTDAITGIRIFTIPVEDVFFAFSLLLMVIGLTAIIEKRSKKLPAT